MQCDRAVIVDAIREHAIRSKFETRVMERDGATIVSLRRRKRGLGRLEAHPSRIDCAIVTGGGRLLFAVDRGFSRWYALYCFLVLAASAVLLIGGSTAIRPGRPFDENVAALCAALIALIGILHGWDLVSGGTLPVTMLSDTVRSAVERSGGTFEPLVDSSGRFHRTGFLYFTYGAVLLAAVVATDARNTLRFLWNDLAVALVLAFLLLTAVVALFIFAAARRHRGFERRLTPALPPLLLVGTYLMFSVPLLFSHAGPQQNNMAMRARQAIERAGWPELRASKRFAELPPATQDAVESAFAFLRAYAAAVVLATFFCFSLGVSAVVYSCRSAYRHLPEYFDLANETEIADIARSARGFRARFQMLAAAIWTAAGVIVLAATTTHALVLLAAIAPAAAPARFRRGVEETTVTVALLFRRPLDEGSTAIARTTHFLFGTTGLLFWSIAPVALARSRRKNRRRLDELAVRSGVVLEIVERLAKNGRIGTPVVAIEESNVPWAAALEHHAFRWRAYVHVSTRACDLLSAPELEAVLAHELSHIALGHCRRDAILLWLGRITLVGDSFVRIAQQTATNETDADAAARLRFGATADSLRTALVKMRNVAAAEAPPLFAGGIPFVSFPLSRYLTRQEYLALPFGQQLRLGVRALRDFYVCGGSRAYWHPDRRHRARALRA